MPRYQTLTRTLTTALAIAAVAAPAALARDIDLRSPDTRDAAEQSQHQQDLRSPDARDAARTSSLADTTSTPRADLRSPDARDASRADQIARAMERHEAVQAALESERYYSSYGTPEPRAQRQSPGPSDDTPWLPIALAITAAGLAAAGVARRTRRARVPA